MPVSAFRTALLGAAAMALAGPALAQGTTSTTPVTPPAARPVTPVTPAVPGTAAVTPSNTAAVAAGPLEAGANSFTEGQARSRIEAAGFSDVGDLTKDDQGIWRGQAMRGGQRMAVGLDFRGHVASGSGASAPVATSRTGTPAGTTAPVVTGTARDGTPGNPPSTAVGRAVDRAQGQTPRPDGTPGNPPGTAVGRAVDRTLGTDMTGANPGANRPDGAPGNPPSTALGRAVDRAQGQTPQPDGTPGNPPGTAVGRALGTSPPASTTPVR